MRLNIIPKQAYIEEEVVKGTQGQAAAQIVCTSRPTVATAETHLQICERVGTKLQFQCANCAQFISLQNYDCNRPLITFSRSL